MPTSEQTPQRVTLPQGARVGWLDGQNLFLDVDSAYRVAQAMAANGDGIVVGVQTLVKRLHEGAWLKSVDERRGKLKVRRSLSGSRLEVLHLPADALELSIVAKSAPIGPSKGEAIDLPGSHEMGGVALVNGVHQPPPVTTPSASVLRAHPGMVRRRF